MTEADAPSVDKRFYLDDLHVGQRFLSRTYLIDAEQIKAFAGQFDPQPFHQDDELAKGTLFGGLAASGPDRGFATVRSRTDNQKNEVAQELMANIASHQGA